jgi:hypothetical protein
VTGTAKTIAAGRARRRRKGRGGARAYCSLNGIRQIATGELFTRIGLLPSRANMTRPFPRSDLREGIAKTFDKIWNHAHATHNAVIRTTWAQLLAALDYADDAQGYATLQRYLTLLAEAGLITFGGIKYDDGSWRCLEIMLLEPPSLASLGAAPVAQLDRAACSCRARRRPETRSEIEALRTRPWRRKTGRGDRVGRWDVEFFSSKSGHSVVPFPSELRSSGKGEIDSKRETRAGASAGSDAGAAPGEQQGETRAGASLGPRRWAALSRCRNAAGEGDTPAAVVDVLRLMATEGADPCSVTAAAFEALYPDHPARVRPGWACISWRWAGRLERAVERLDRRDGAGAGVQRLLDLMLEWQPTLAGLVGLLKRPDAFELVSSPGLDDAGEWVYESTRAGQHGPWPVSAAMFIQQLHRESKLAAIDARGSQTYKQLDAIDRHWRDRPDADADELGIPKRAGQVRQVRRAQLAGAELLRRARAGDADAQRELVRRVEELRRGEDGAE